MTARELSEEIFWSNRRRWPWRLAGDAQLYVNGWVRQLIAQLTDAPSGWSWRGKAFRADEVVILVRLLRGLVGLTRGGRKAVRCLAATIEAVTDGGRTLAIIQDGPDVAVRDRIAMHERFHQWQFEATNEKAIAHSLAAHPYTQKAIPHLHRYDRTEVVSEIAAHIASGDCSAVGLTNVEGRRWMRAYLSLARNN